jgi:hypothetical protein
MRNTNYKCLETELSGKYIDLRDMKKVGNLGYYIKRNFVIIKFRKLRWSERVVRMGDTRSVYGIFMGKMLRK